MKQKWREINTAPQRFEGLGSLKMPLLFKGHFFIVFPQICDEENLQIIHILNELFVSFIEVLYKVVDKKYIKIVNH